MNTEELIELVQANHADVKKKHEAAEAKADKALEALRGLTSEISTIEQKMARGFNGIRTGAGIETKTWGQAVVESPEFTSFKDGGFRTPARLEVKTVSTIGSGTSLGGPLITPDYRADLAVALPQRRLTIRDLLAPGSTSGNMIYYPRMVTRQINAAMVAESAQKPQSDFTMESASAPVRTLAHFTQVSRQAFDDAPALQSLIDSELRYGLGFVEEAEILNGDGTGQHILCIIPQATAISAAFSVTGETAIDRLALAILQSELGLLPASGIVLNPTDWRKITMLKDAQGRYIIANPGERAPPVLWGLDVVATPAIAAGSFLVGAFKSAAQIFDRMAVEILLSSEHGNNFTTNEITVRCEERLAMAVKRPAALITGSLP